MKYQYLFFISLNIFPLLNYLYLFVFQDVKSGFIFVYSLSVIISLYCFWIALKLFLKEQALNASILSLEKSRQFYTQQAEQLHELEEKTRTIQENFQHQLNVLASNIVQGNYREANAYLQKISASHKSSQLPVYCSNTLINAILQAKKTEAEKYNIHTDFHIEFPELIRDLSGLGETDLCSLLFNLLDNAMEACQASETASPFFKLTIYSRGNILHFHMINSKNSSVSFNRRTTKSDSVMHGFGIMIIEEIAKKYNGYCLWEDKKETFCSNIMLNLSGDQKEGNL